MRLRGAKSTRYGPYVTRAGFGTQRAGGLGGEAPHRDRCSDSVPAELSAETAPPRAHLRNLRRPAAICRHPAASCPPSEPPPPTPGDAPERLIGDGDGLELGDLRFTLIATPGHRFLDAHGAFQRLEALVEGDRTIIDREGRPHVVSAERLAFSRAAARAGEVVRSFETKADGSGWTQVTDIANDPVPDRARITSPCSARHDGVTPSRERTPACDAP